MWPEHSKFKIIGNSNPGEGPPLPLTTSILFLDEVIDKTPIDWFRNKFLGKVLQIFDIWPSFFYFPHLYSLKKEVFGLTWWLSGKESPANAGDVGSIPDLGTFHITQGNSACVSQLLSWAWVLEPTCHSYSCLSALQPALCNKRSHRDEKPVHHQLESNPSSPHLHKSPLSNGHTP